MYTVVRRQRHLASAPFLGVGPLGVEHVLEFAEHDLSEYAGVLELQGDARRSVILGLWAG
eukprot:534313-Pyramimonas_sp.AAC.1